MKNDKSLVTVSMDDVQKLAVNFFAIKENKSQTLYDIKVTPIVKGLETDNVLFDDYESDMYFYFGLDIPKVTIEELNKIVLHYADIIDEADNGFLASMDTYFEVLNILQIKTKAEPYIEKGMAVEKNGLYFSRITKSFIFGEEVIRRMMQPVEMDNNLPLLEVREKFKGATIQKTMYVPNNGLLHRIVTSDGEVLYLLEKKKQGNGLLLVQLLLEIDVICLLTVTCYHYDIVVETLIREIVGRKIKYNEAVIMLIESGSFLFDYQIHCIEDITVKLYPRSSLYVFYYADSGGDLEEKVELNKINFFEYILKAECDSNMDIVDKLANIISYLNGQLSKQVNIKGAVELIEMFTGRMVACRTMRFNEIFSEYDLVWSGSNSCFDLATNILHEEQLPCELGYKENSIRTKFDGTILVNPFESTPIALIGDEFLEPLGFNFKTFNALNPKDATSMSITVEGEYPSNCIQYANLIVS